jgi:ribosomal protein S19
MSSSTSRCRPLTECVLLQGRTLCRKNAPEPTTTSSLTAIYRIPTAALKVSTNDCALYRLPIVRPEPGKKIAPIRTQARSATILPNFVGLKFQVHNGKVYHDVTITEEMVGHKLGEFSPYDIVPLDYGPSLERNLLADDMVATGHGSHSSGTRNKRHAMLDISSY